MNHHRRDAENAEVSQRVDFIVQVSFRYLTCDQAGMLGGCMGF